MVWYPGFISGRHFYHLAFMWKNVRPLGAAMAYASSGFPRKAAGLPQVNGDWHVSEMWGLIFGASNLLLKQIGICVFLECWFFFRVENRFVDIMKHKQVSTSGGDFIHGDFHTMTWGWETVQALLDVGADPKARAANGTLARWLWMDLFAKFFSRIFRLRRSVFFFKVGYLG